MKTLSSITAHTKISLWKGKNQQILWCVFLLHFEPVEATMKSLLFLFVSILSLCTLLKTGPDMRHIMCWCVIFTIALLTGAWWIGLCRIESMVSVTVFLFVLKTVMLQVLEWTGVWNMWKKSTKKIIYRSYRHEQLMHCLIINFARMGSLISYNQLTTEQC